LSSKEFERFDNTMRKLIQVPHEKLKAALDEEKRDKNKERRKSKKTSALARESREQD